jgi:ankyrin repeat protein
MLACGGAAQLSGRAVSARMTKEWEAATRSGNLDTVVSLLQSGANVNALDRYNQTALMHAAHRGDLPLVKLLVENGAELNVRAKLNLSAIDLARIGGHEAVVSFLLSVGAEPVSTGAGQFGAR